MQCKNCQIEYEKWGKGPIENHLCLDCNTKAWKKWEAEESDSLKKIKELQSKGHLHHCACRQVWGDGKCECNMYAKGYDPYAWMKN